MNERFDIVRKFAIVIAILAFLALAIGSAMTNRPQIDEGMFADPARNLVENGFFGTTSLEREGSPLLRIEQRTYWVMPLFLLNAAASFEVAGVGLTQLRLVSVFWGLMLLASVYLIALQLSRDKWVATLALMIVAADYMVLETGSQGRMDMMSASLGFAAIAAYLVLRERNLLWAVLASQTIMTIDGLTHPNAIMAWIGLACIAIYFDRKRIKLVHFAVAAIPYLIGGAAFAYWVSLDPPAFMAQFVDNATMTGRMDGFHAPLTSIAREITERYPHAFGLAASSSGHSGPIWLKSLILVGYIAGIAGAAFIKELRSKLFPLLVPALLYSLILSILDGQKQTTYLIHVVPLFAIFLAATVVWVWQNMPKVRIPMAASLLAVMAISAGGMALRIKQDTKDNFYVPMTRYLNENAQYGELVMGGSELIFGLDSSVSHVADGRFAFYTHKKPEFIVTDSAVEDSWTQSQRLFPAFYEYLPRLLNEEYSITYENPAFKVYRRKH